MRKNIAVKRLMNNMLILIVKLCFCIWLVTSILPGNIPADCKIIQALFQAGKYLNIIILILGLTAFAIPIFSKKKPAASGEKEFKLILHDLDIEAVDDLFKNVSNTQFFCTAVF